MWKYLMGIIVAVLIVVAMISWYTPYYSGPKSDHFDGKRFFDPEANIDKRFWDVLKWQFTRDKAAWPKQPPMPSYVKPEQRIHGDQLRVTNVGHATFLIQTQGVNILTDPIWSERASPVSFAGPKRVSEPGVRFENLPPIDVVWISHNHYDQLDIATLKRLWEERKPRIIAALGNDTIIHSYDKHIKVETYDWGDTVTISPKLSLHLSPMQHWSARGLLDRNKALWAAVTFLTPGGNIYFVGDTGYGEGRYFKRIRAELGAFRLAILPMGAYKPRWFMRYAHMNPEEMVRAYHDLGQPYTIPCHYDVIPLADEPWGEAKVKLQQAINTQGVGDKIKTLGVGQVFDVPKSEA